MTDRAPSNQNSRSNPRPRSKDQNQRRLCQDDQGRLIQTGGERPLKRRRKGTPAPSAPQGRSNDPGPSNRQDSLTNQDAFGGITGLRDVQAFNEQHTGPSINPGPSNSQGPSINPPFPPGFFDIPPSFDQPLTPALPALDNRPPAPVPNLVLPNDPAAFNRPHVQTYQIPSNENGPLNDYGPLNMQGPFRSKNLIYVCPTDNDQWMLMEMSGDPMRPEIDSVGLPWKMDRVRSARIMAILQNALFGVIVCFRFEDPNVMPLPIGIMYMEKRYDVPGRPTVDFNIANSMLDPDTLLANLSADLSIWLLKGWQGSGNGSEAVRWMLKQGFEGCGLHRIAMSVPQLYPKAIGLCNKLRFQHEGHAREAHWLPSTGIFVATVHFGMLKAEYDIKKTEWEGMQNPGFEAVIRECERLNDELSQFPE